MRLVLLTVLSTLIVLLAPTKAVSPDFPGRETKTMKWKYDTTSTIRSSPTEVNVNEKRSLRGDDNSTDMEVLNPDDEQRAAPLLTRYAYYMKAVHYGLSLRFTPNTHWKWTPRFEDELFTAFYKFKGPRGTANFKSRLLAARYKDWFQKKRRREKPGSRLTGTETRVRLISRSGLR